MSDDRLDNWKAIRPACHRDSRCLRTSGRFGRRQKQKFRRWGVYGLTAAIVLFVLLSADWAKLRRTFLDPDIAADLFPDIITIAAKNTIILAVLAFTGGILLGLLLALMRLSSVRFYRWLALAYIEFFRGIPALLTLILIGFYAVFVVNVTGWLLRSEGVRLWEWIPNALGPFNGLASIVTFALGLAAGRWIGSGSHANRVAMIIAFGGTTMLCAGVALKTVSIAVNSGAFLPDILSQVSMTAPFVIGLIGGVSAAGFRPPVVLLGLAERRA